MYKKQKTNSHPQIKLNTSIEVNVTGANSKANVERSADIMDQWLIIQ